VVGQKELLKILNRERDYEDGIAKDLFAYINYSLDDISDLTSKEKDMIGAVLSTIAHESAGHYQMFTKLIEKCIDDKEIN